MTEIHYKRISNLYSAPLGGVCIHSHGIKEPNRVFERFYKESERGLGIGLHIVEKLCTELHIDKSLTVDKTRVTVSLSLSEVTS